jgi:hypothetical protein
MQWKWCHHKLHLLINSIEKHHTHKHYHVSCTKWIPKGIVQGIVFFITLRESVRMKLTLPKWELGSPLGLPKLQSSIAGVKNTSHWGFLYIIGKLLKFRCRKWPRMGHLDICSTSYGKKKGWELNWQFDSRPLKVGNQPDPGACRWSATHRLKTLEENYKFISDLIPIGGLRKKLWSLKVLRVRTGTISGLLLGSFETKNHLDVGAMERHRIYYMGEGGGFPRV